jgi:hypothetical protein
MVSRVFKKSHWCFKARHQASINEFEKEISVIAKSRWSKPDSISSSTPALKSSTPPSVSNALVIERM